MRPYLLVDIGSTFTKVTLVDAAAPALLGRARAPTTAATDAGGGLRAAVAQLERQFGPLPSLTARLAASSARGGLRMVAIGLIPELTAQAAREAALGAGARVVATYAGRLNASQVAELQVEQPDLILLAGGTDGGNAEVVFHNARLLAASALEVATVYAGNSALRSEIVEIFRRAGRRLLVTNNVMPRLGELCVEPARNTIRDVFLELITEAPGMDAIRRSVDAVLMPTPAAVLNSARLLAGGGEGCDGHGPVLVVDVGGATTDVHSVSPGGALAPGVTVRGLEAPYVKRTVEGDLGMRESAPALLEAVGLPQVLTSLVGISPDFNADDRLEARLIDYVKGLAGDRDRLPAGDWEVAVDHALAGAAIAAAVRRHAGTIRQLPGPAGPHLFQYGKDLRPIQNLIGTGGSLAHARHPRRLLAKALFTADEPQVLRPVAPCGYIDEEYLLAPLGLLAEVEPAAALQLLRRHLRPLGRLERRSA